jgi:hypothetical protein
MIGERFYLHQGIGLKKLYRFCFSNFWEIYSNFYSIDPIILYFKAVFIYENLGIDIFATVVTLLFCSISESIFKELTFRSRHSLAVWRPFGYAFEDILSLPSDYLNSFLNRDYLTFL